MQQYSNSLFRQFPNSVSGNAAIGVSVNVYELGTTNHVTLYADDNLGGATLPNPLTTNDIGFYSFYAPDGKYTLHFGSSQFPDLNIQLIDALSLVNEFNTAIDATGYILVDNGFSAGYTVTQRNEALLFDGVYYVWKGALNKAVPPASSPATTGGIGDGAWQAVLDNALRQQLMETGGAGLINFGTVSGIDDATGTDVAASVNALISKDVPNIKSLGSIAPVGGFNYSVVGYCESTTVGGGLFRWNANRSYADHNAVNVFALGAISSWDGSQDDLATLRDWTGVGVGCFERLNYGKLTPEMAGVAAEGTTSGAISTYPQKKDLSITSNKAPTTRPTKIGQIILDSITGDVYAATNTDYFSRLSRFFGRRYFFEFDSTRRNYILLDSAYTGDIKLRVYPYRSGNQGLPAGSPSLSNHTWAEFTVSVTSLTEIGKNGSQYFTGIIEYVELVTSDVYDHLTNQSSRLHGITGTLKGLNSWIAFNKLQDGSWVSDDITPLNPATLGATWSQVSQYEYTVTNGTLDTDELRLFSSTYSLARKLKLLIELSPFSNAMKVTNENVDARRAYRAGVYDFFLDQKTIQFSRVSSASPITGTVKINSVRIQIGAI